MFSKFLNVPPEKQVRIVNAALKEFAEKGYDDASTNEIVQEAKISKGLLFHYFKNKKQLFLYLYDYCVEHGMKEIYAKIDLTETDLFVRLRQASIAKLDLLRRHPEIFTFFELAYGEDSTEVRDELSERKKAILVSGVNLLFDGLDLSMFREGIDVKKGINIILWTFEGLVKEELAKGRSQQVDYSKVFAEGDIYIEILRNCFYKSSEEGYKHECD